MGNEQSQRRKPASKTGHTGRPVRTSPSQSFDGDIEGTPIGQQNNTGVDTEIGEEVDDGSMMAVSPGEDNDGSIMSGLPGEIVPESSSMDSVQKELSSHPKNIPSSLNPLPASDQNHSTLSEEQIPSNKTVVPVVNGPSFLGLGLSLVTEASPGQMSEINNNLPGDFYKQTCVGVENLSVIENSGNTAEENRKVAITLDETGIFKRRVTSNTDDNRHASFFNDNEQDDISVDSQEKPFPTVLSNVMFFPDKSKGASPKRYGPKRLGTAVINLPEISESSTEFSESETENESEINETLCDLKSPQGSGSMVTLVGDNESQQNSSVLKMMPEQRQESTTGASENLIFVEDHFAVLTGCEASGGACIAAPLSDMQSPVSVDGTSIDINPVNTGVPFTGKKCHFQDERNDNVGNTNISMVNQQGSRNFGEPGQNSVENINTTSKTTDDKLPSNQTVEEQSTSSPRKDKKTDSKRRGKKKKDKTEKKRKGKKLLEPKSEATKAKLAVGVESELEYCSKCKQRNDLCGCLLFEYEAYILSRRRLAEPAYRRFSRICDKKVPWSELKSRQAEFACHLKSFKTPIFQDNRVCLEFKLPFNKGKRYEPPPARLNDFVASSLKQEQNTVLIQKHSESDDPIQHLFINESESFSERTIIFNDFDDISEGINEHVGDNSNVPVPATNKDADDDDFTPGDDKPNDSSGVFEMDFDDGVEREECNPETVGSSTSQPPKSALTSASNGDQVYEDSWYGMFEPCYNNPTYNVNNAIFNNRKYLTELERHAPMFDIWDTHNGEVDESTEVFHNHIDAIEDGKDSGLFGGSLHEEESLKKDDIANKDELHRASENDHDNAYEFKTEGSDNDKKVDAYSNQHNNEDELSTGMKTCLSTSESDISLPSTLSTSPGDFKSTNIPSAMEKVSSNNENSGVCDGDNGKKININDDLPNNEQSEKIEDNAYQNNEHEILEDDAQLEGKEHELISENVIVPSKSDTGFLGEINHFRNTGVLKRLLTKQPEDNRMKYSLTDTTCKFGQLSLIFHKSCKMNFYMGNSKYDISAENVDESSNDECIDSKEEDLSMKSEKSDDEKDKVDTDELTDAVPQISETQSQRLTTAERVDEDNSDGDREHTPSVEHPNHSILSEKEQKHNNKANLETLTQHKGPFSSSLGKRNSLSDEIFDNSFESSSGSSRKSSSCSNNVISNISDDTEDGNTEALAYENESGVQIDRTAMPKEYLWMKGKLTNYEDDNRLQNSTHEEESRNDDTEHANVEIQSKTDNKSNGSTQDRPGTVDNFTVRDIEQSERDKEICLSSPDDTEGVFDCMDPLGFHGYGGEDQMSGMLGNMRFHIEQLRHRRAPKRPAEAQSDFARSLYECAEQGMEMPVEDDVIRCESDSNSGSLSSTVSLESLVFLSEKSVEKVNEDAEMKVNKNVEPVQIAIEEVEPRTCGEDNMNDGNSHSCSTDDLLKCLADTPGAEGILTAQQPSTSTENTTLTSKDSAKIEGDLIAELPKWYSRMADQLAKCKAVKGLPHSCRATVLCVDASSSMSGEPWIQTKSHIRTFLQYLDQVQKNSGIEEYVSLVIFGGKTQVLVQLCTEYYQLRMAVERIVPAGPCCMLPGLSLALYCLAPFKGRRYAQAHEIILENRIILFSTGHPDCWQYIDPCTDKSQDGSMSGTAALSLFPFKAVEDLQCSLQEWVKKKLLETNKAGLHCVPVGDNPNMVCFEALRSAVPGTKVYYDNIQQLGRSTHNHYIAAQISTQMFHTSEEFDVATFKLFLDELFPERTKADVTDIVGIAEDAHIEYVARKNDPLSNSDGPDYRLGVKNLPPFGSRVTPGPDMTEEDKSFVSDKGTIIEHVMNAQGKVFVQWDNGYRALYDLDYRGQCSVIPDETPVQCRLENPVKLGDTVRRGPDWKFGNQDGGSDQIGRVYDISQQNTVLVRWSNGNIGNYRCGQSGIYDVIISEPEDPDGVATFTADMNRQNMEHSKREQ